MNNITCRVCKLSKPKKDMATDNRIQCGHTTICKSCASKLGGDRYKRGKRQKQDYDLRRNYGISMDDYDKMSVAQGHRCAICNSQEMGKNKSRFSVDHDHITGRIRALLCNKCNQGIELMNDDPELLEKAAKYIHTFREIE